MKEKFEGKFNGAGDVVCMFAASNEEMEKNIGRKVEFKKFSGITRKEAEAKGMMGWGYAGTHEIIGVQKIWNGDIAYRVVSKECDDTFGKPAQVKDINFLQS